MTAKRPIISIIIPVYKAENYIRKCLDSIVYQTLKDIEIIIVDDCSPDCSGYICDEYARKDTRIRVIHKKRMEELVLHVKLVLNPQRASMSFMPIQMIGWSQKCWKICTLRQKRLTQI